MTWQREQTPDGLHPLFDDILRRQLLLPREQGKTAAAQASESTREILRIKEGAGERPRG